MLHVWSVTHVGLDISHVRSDISHILGAYLLQAKLSQWSSTYFVYVVECVTFKGAYNSELKAVLGHTRHNQCSESLSGLMRPKLEEWINMDHLAANCQDPCSHPYFITLFTLVLQEFWIMFDRRGEGGELMLFMRNDVPCFNHEINDLQWQVMGEEEGEASKFQLSVTSMSNVEWVHWGTLYLIEVWNLSRFKNLVLGSPR